ncbi:universal stress protein [Nitrospira sp. Nam80]
MRRLAREVERIAKETASLLASFPALAKVRTGRGSPAVKLLQHCRPGDLLIVGNRGLGAFERYLLGSVSLKALPAALCS